MKQLVDIINSYVEVNENTKEKPLGIHLNPVSYFNKSKKIFGNYSSTALDMMVGIYINHQRESK